MSPSRAAIAACLAHALLACGGSQPAPQGAPSSSAGTGSAAPGSASSDKSTVNAPDASANANASPPSSDAGAGADAEGATVTSTGDVSCDALTALTASQDATPVIQDCIARASVGRRVELPSGAFVLHSTLIIDKSVVLVSAGRDPNVRGPSNRDGLDGSASLAILPDDPAFDPMQSYALQIDAPNVTLSNVILDMNLHSAGVLVNASNTTIVNNVITHAVRTALVTAQDLTDIEIDSNDVYHNGEHKAADGARTYYSDGITILDGVRYRITRNSINATDVGLITGGCIDCTISGNNLTWESDMDNPARGAFAAMAIHAWPHTKGDHSGTVVTGNSVVCGALCGFGLYLGNLSWYEAPPVQNGSIRANSFNAQIAIYIDHAVNTELTDDNGVSMPASGTWPTSCAGLSTTPLAFALATDPVPGAIIQMGLGTTAPNLFNNEKTLIDLRGCIPNWPGP